MSTYRWELLLHVHLPLGIATTCPPTAGNDGGIRSEEPEQTQGGGLLHHVHLPLGIASCPPTAGNCFTTCPPTAGNDGGICSEEAEQTQGGRLLPLHVHLPLGIASQQASVMSTYRWE